MGPFKFPDVVHFLEEPHSVSRFAVNASGAISLRYRRNMNRTGGAISTEGFACHSCKVGAAGRLAQDPAAMLALDRCAIGCAGITWVRQHP